MEAPQHELVRSFDFVLDRKADIPIGVQLVWAIRTRIADGRLVAGARLPALRDVAHALELNANTVRVAYSRLEREGLLESRQGSGTFVSDSPRTTPASAIAALAATQALSSDVDPRDVAAALYSTTPEQISDEDIELARRRELRTQIISLQRTLDELRAQYPSLARVPHSAAAAQSPPPRLPNAAELQATRAELVRRLAALQAAVDALDVEAYELSQERAAQESAVPARTRRRAAKGASSQDGPERVSRKPPRSRPSPATS